MPISDLYTDTVEQFNYYIVVVEIQGMFERKKKKTFGDDGGLGFMVNAFQSRTLYDLHICIC